MQRIKFKKTKQKAFLKRVIQELNSPSLRAILQFGFNIPYATLKNYYTERRSLPQDLFEDLCYISKINPDSLNIQTLKPNFGQIRGGKKSKKYSTPTPHNN